MRPRFSAQETVTLIGGKERRLSTIRVQAQSCKTKLIEDSMILTGWKEIASHLRYGVRTAQRWEHNGLPVKRVNKSPRSPVVADSEALDAWILHRLQLPSGASRELRDNLLRTRELRREVQESRKELRARMGVLRKTLAEARAKLRRRG